jgi:hypothetical protein
MSMRGLAFVAALTLTMPAAGGASTRASHFPTGTYLGKTTAADLRAAGLDAVDAHWDLLTFRADGTWSDVWFHPRVPSQPTAHGHYVVHGDTLRLLGTPDTVRWRFDGHALHFAIVHVPDRLARLGYTAHPWRKIR